MKLKNKGVLLAGLFVVAAAFIAAGCGGDSGGGAPEALPSSSCTGIEYKGDGDPDYTIASDLPLQGSSRTQTEQMVAAIRYALDQADWWRDPQSVEKVREPLLRAAGWYFLRARNSHDAPLDAVARFHLGNGARLERINVLADTSPRALQQSYGLMVNYLYDLDDIEQNHEAYAQQHAIIAAGRVNKLVRAPLREVNGGQS